MTDAPTSLSTTTQRVSDAPAHSQSVSTATSALALVDDDMGK